VTGSINSEIREMMTSKDALRQQIAYYKARAGEYDQWHRREGRYYRGEEHRHAWLAELDTIREAVVRSEPRGRALELACGTGLWTGLVAESSDSLLAVDASLEALAINRARDRGPHVEFVQADLFSWRPNGRFDFVFLGFWISHVPDDRFDGFWRFVDGVLEPDGRVFLVDSLWSPDSSAVDHARPGRGGVVERKVNDGRTFEIVKVFHEPAALERRLGEAGFKGRIHTTSRFFYYGCLRNGRQ
jgi:demethylmenaquinone methyltransferase/2-methoxy-6-polyprenyl-1,4-benzoquinol methylase